MYQHFCRSEVPDHTFYHCAERTNCPRDGSALRYRAKHPPTLSSRSQIIGAQEESTFNSWPPTSSPKGDSRPFPSPPPGIEKHEVKQEPSVSIMFKYKLKNNKTILRTWIVLSPNWVNQPRGLSPLLGKSSDTHGGLVTSMLRTLRASRYLT